MHSVPVNPELDGLKRGITLPQDLPSPNDTADSVQYSEVLARTVLDSISAHIAILDGDGKIVETNRAWKEYAEKNQCPVDAMGMNYLGVCDVAYGDGAVDAKKVAEGIRSVIKGEIEEFLHDYPCHSPEGNHWFYMRAVRMWGVEPVRVVVSHENITALKLTEEALTKSREEIEEQKQSLEEGNIALKVLLKQRENDKTELERKVLTNVKDLIMPYMERLKNAPLRPREKTLVDIVDTHLNEIISPLLQTLSHADIILTPQEIQVAALVKDGKTSKEIADVLNISETTVHFHRKNLRQKFNLKSRQVNLRSYLLSMS